VVFSFQNLSKLSYIFGSKNVPTIARSGMKDVQAVCLWKSKAWFFFIHSPSRRQPLCRKLRKHKRLKRKWSSENCFVHGNTFEQVKVHADCW